MRKVNSNMADQTALFDPNTIVSFITANISTFLIILQIVYVAISIINLIREPKIVVVT